MQGVKGHAPVRDVLQAAGLTGEENRVKETKKGRRHSMGEFGTVLVRRRQTIGVMEHSLPASHMTDEEWMAERTQSLERMKQKKYMRRAFGGDHRSADVALYFQTSEENKTIGEAAS